ncbi:hypothetical protein CDAR_386761 [Caerostris darwini]|uniref:Uncharacterized protein n=1 Tax=Caerostris darwini TaxID=1538125 RepID=A0AAV4UEL7_9ARAC|nr:hypothetical protein CDAR_386761 [Caerostris darwini]
MTSKESLYSNYLITISPFPGIRRKSNHRSTPFRLYLKLRSCITTNQHRRTRIRQFLRPCSTCLHLAPSLSMRALSHPRDSHPSPVPALIPGRSGRRRPSESPARVIGVFFAAYGQ